MTGVQTCALPICFPVTIVQRILDAKEACVSFGIKALDHITTNRNVYDDADENGLSVFEVTSDPKAKAEIEGIAQEFLGV